MPPAPSINSPVVSAIRNSALFRQRRTRTPVTSIRERASVVVSSSISKTGKRTVNRLFPFLLTVPSTERRGLDPPGGRRKQAHQHDQDRRRRAARDGGRALLPPGSPGLRRWANEARPGHHGTGRVREPQVPDGRCGAHGRGEEGTWRE